MKELRTDGWMSCMLLAAAFAAVPVVLPAQVVPAERQLTFAKHVAPILQQKCEVCHRPNNIGPMPLRTFQEVRPWLRSIKTKVTNREMPPWYLDKTVGIQKFINDQSLSESEIDTIVGWIDSGAPLGSLADMPSAREWPSGERFFLEDSLGPPDLVVRSKPWTMPAAGPDVMFEAVVDVPELTEPRWVRASETKPSLVGRRIAHHSSVHIVRPQDPAVIEKERSLRADQPGSQAALDARRRSENELFTEWAQGKGGETYADNVGKLVMPGTKVEFDIHYHAVGEEITDVMETAWWFHPKGKTPRYSAEWVPVGCVHCGSDRLQIPPHSVTQHQGTFVLQAPAILHNFQPHMHYRGKAMTLEAIYPDGRREVINRILRYDNNWHINYIYDPDYAPVFPKGTVLLLTAVHDNTSANKNNPDPRQWVSGGSRTVDEMAHFNEQVIYISDADYEQIVEQRRKRGLTQQN